MPCIDINPMLDALEKRKVDPRKSIAQVQGSGQAGTTLRISHLNEKLWMADTLYVGMVGFVPLESYEPSEDPIEISIYPPMITSGMYQNMGRPFHNGECITRGPVMPKEN